MTAGTDAALLGARLRRWRDEQNLSGPDVAGKVAATGLAFSWAELRPIEQGETVPDEQTIAALAAAFERSVTELVEPQTDAEAKAEAAILNPDGDDDRPSELRERSPYRPNAVHAPPVEGGWDLVPGEQIKRTDVHKRFGGGRQGGIAPCRTSPNVLVFSDPTASTTHGHFDHWNDERTVFFYGGEGQTGDQGFLRGNRAIHEHHKDKRALRLFEGSNGTVTYAGRFEVDPDHRYDYEPAKSGDARRVIMFRLLPVTDLP